MDIRIGNTWVSKPNNEKALAADDWDEADGEDEWEIEDFADEEED